jgi:hypothetical protein
MANVEDAQTARHGYDLRSRGLAILSSLSRLWSERRGERQRPEPPSLRHAGDVRNRAGRRSTEALEWCSIVYGQTGREGAFRVLAVKRGGRRRTIARSATFRMKRAGEPQARGVPRREHDALVEHLESRGWERIATPGRWHDTAFVRVAREDAGREPTADTGGRSKRGSSKQGVQPAPRRPRKH